MIMIWHITKRELLDHFNSLRFALTAGLTTLLMVLNALLFINGDYKQRLEAYSKRTATVSEVVKKSTAHLNDLATYGPIDLYKKPSPFAFCAKGQEDILPVRVQAGRRDNWSQGYGRHYYEWIWPWKLEYVQDSYRKYSMQRLFIALDWSFIVGVVMSFIAILFTFDAISSERERGTLSLALSNPISRGVFILGKFAGAFLAISIPLLIGILLNVLIVGLSGLVSFNGSAWARLGLMAAVSLIYVGIFIGLGLAVSSRMRHSSTSLLVLLTFWVGIAVLIPNTLGSLVGKFQQVSSDWEQKRRAALEDVSQKTGGTNYSYLFQYGSPSDKNPRIEALERWANVITPYVETQSRFNDEELDERFTQAEFARRMLHISPTAIYNYAMEALAGTGFQRHKQFVQASRRYREQFITFIKEMDRADPESSHVYYIKEGLSKKPVSFDSIPKFKEPTGVGVAFRSALMDMSLLILIAGLCFMASYLAFLKCVVKCEAEDISYHHPVPDDRDQPDVQEKFVLPGDMHPNLTQG